MRPAVAQGQSETVKSTGCGFYPHLYFHFSLWCGDKRALSFAIQHAMPPELSEK